MTRKAKSRGRSHASLAARLAKAKTLIAKERLRLARQTRPGCPDTIVSGSWSWAERLLEERRSALLRIPGVLGCGLGFRKRGGIQTGEPCLTVFVRRKWDKDHRAGSAERRLPRFLKWRGRRIAVDVVELGTLQREGKIHAGASIGPAVLASGIKKRGTLGAYAVDDATSAIVALTAMHVMGIDEYEEGPADAPFPVYHPSLADSDAATRFGRLLRGSRTGMDAAEMALDDPATAWQVLPEIGPIRGWRPTTYPGDQGTPVRVYGAVSGLRNGQLVTPAIHLPEFNLDSAILADIHTAPGDSGCALVDPQNLVLGFLVGKTASGFRVFCPAGLALARLRCDIPSS